MREEVRNGLIAAICGIIVMLLIVALIAGAKERNEGREIVCKNIGNKLDLDFYGHGEGDCGWGIDCMYQCKFINQNGGIVIKNVM